MMYAATATPLVHPPIAGPITRATVDLRHVIRFATGLPGFENCRSFVLMASDGDDALHYLTALEGPAASFLVIDPRRVQPDYRCELTEGDAQRLGVQDLQTPLLWLALVMLEENGTVTRQSAGAGRHQSCPHGGPAGHSAQHHLSSSPRLYRENNPRLRAAPLTHARMPTRGRATRCSSSRAGAGKRS